MSQQAIAPFDFPDHEYSERLIPRSLREVSSPNPSPTTAAVGRAIAAAGPLPGGSTSGWKNLRTKLIVAVVLLAIAISAIIGEDTSISSGWQGLAVAVFVLVLVVAAGRQIRSIRSSTWGARRLGTASEKGWIEYYPALLSEIWQTGRHVPHADPTEYYYKAKVRLFLPDGTVQEIISDEFESHTSPRAFREQGIAVARFQSQATFEHTTGWYIAAHLATKPFRQASLHNGLTREQVSAGLNAAASPAS